MLSIFSCVFFGKTSIHVFCPFSDWIDVDCRAFDAMLENLDLILQSEGGEDSVGKYAFDAHALDKHQR